MQRKSAFTPKKEGLSRTKVADASLGLGVPVEMTSGMRCLVSGPKHDLGYRLISAMFWSWDARYGSCDRPARELLVRSC